MPNKKLTLDLRLSDILHAADIEYPADFDHEDKEDSEEETLTPTDTCSGADAHDDLHELLIDQEWIEIIDFQAENAADADADIFAKELNQYNQLLALQDEQERKDYKKDIEKESEAIQELKFNRLWDEYYTNLQPDLQSSLEKDISITAALQHYEEIFKIELAKSQECLAQYKAEQAIEDMALGQTYLIEHQIVQAMQEIKDVTLGQKHEIAEYLSAESFDPKQQRAAERALSMRYDKSHQRAVSTADSSEKDALKTILFNSKNAWSKKRIKDVMRIHLEESKSDKASHKFFDRHARLHHSRQNELLLEMAKKERGGIELESLENQSPSLNCRRG